MYDPIIHLAIDNCFAYKRWTRPIQWARVIAEMGIQNIEASADTELDPLFMGPAYLADWVGEAKEALKATGTRLSALYSGHGTYSTLGLTHTDAGVRRRMTDEWFKPMVDMAAATGAGLGFYAHGFADEVLQDARRYEGFYENLRASLSELSAYGGEKGLSFMCLEQMYAPHMVPWRIGETEELVRTVSARSGVGFYITEDLGHHGTRFLRPTRTELIAALEALRAHPEGHRPWLGPVRAYAIFEEALRRDDDPGRYARELEALFAENERFFAGAQDGDCYAWLRRLGPFSPIIHLQQTDGHTSAHWPFTRPYNERGIIRPERVLRALAEGCASAERAGMPAPCPELYLTLEVFTGTTAYNDDVLRDYRASVRYWREWIPEDGRRLSELL